MTSSQESSSTLNNGDITASSVDSWIEPNGQTCKLSTWMECGSLLYLNEEEKLNLGKWVLCINDADSQNTANRVWEVVETKVTIGEFCYAKRTKTSNVSEDEAASNHTQLVFIYTADCFDVKAVKRAADVIRKEVYSDFHVMCYFQESAMDWERHYHCQNLLFKYTSDGKLFKLKSNADEGKVETELDQIPEQADIGFDNRNSVDDDENNLNQNYFCNSQSQTFDCSQRTVIDCHAEDNDIVKFLDQTVEAVERIMTSRQIGDNENVILGDDVQQCSQSSIGSLGNGFEDMMLASQKADKAELEGFSQIDLSSQRNDNTTEMGKNGNLNIGRSWSQGSQVSGTDSAKFEEHLERVQKSVDELQKVKISRAPIEVEESNSELERVMVANEEDMLERESGCRNEPKFEFNSEHSGTQMRLSKIDALTERMEERQRERHARLTSVTERLLRDSKNQSNEDKHNSDLTQTFGAFHAKMNEIQAENEKKLYEMKSRIAKMRENVREITSKRKVELVNVADLQEGESGNNNQGIGYDFMKKRSEHKQKIAEMKQRVHEAMSRIKALNENARLIGTDQLISQEWDLVEMDANQA